MLGFNTCVICGRDSVDILKTERDTFKVDCPRCGKFEITDHAVRLVRGSNDSSEQLNLSYWVRRNQIEGKYPYLDLKLTRELLVPFVLPRPIHQVNNLVLWLGDNQKIISEGVDILYSDLIPVIGCTSGEDVEIIVKHLEENKIIVLIDEVLVGAPKLLARLTFAGWEKYYELKSTPTDSKLAFMAMKFANDTLAKIFNEVIKESVSKTGFEIRRLDEEKRAGLIDDKLRVEIRRSKFLIADLTDDNNGAYWEAGYAEGLGMPVIYICEESKFDQRATHFDTNHHLTVKWKDDPDSLIKFAEELKATIRATFPAEAKMED